MLGMPVPLRDAEKYGDVVLSVQASVFHYSTPKTNSLPLESYTHVEIGIRDNKGGLCCPSDIEVIGFDHLFEEGNVPVAGYVSQHDLERLRTAIKARLANNITDNEE